MTGKTIRNMKVVVVSALLALSIFSFAFLKSVDNDKAITVEQAVLVEDLDKESEEVLPDVHLIKHIMQKAVEFITMNLPGQI